MKMEFDITKMVEEIAMQAKENQEEFIIETIHPYCENILQIKINKEELKQILLNGIRKQQPCEDECIEKGEAIRRIEVRRDITCKSDPYSYEEWTKGYEEGIDDAIAMINSVPSVTPKTTWIPVDERLPDNRGYYLTTVKIEIHDLNKLYYEIRTAQFDGKDFDVGYIGDGFSVIAWMPLLEPYKESDNNDK